MKPLKYQSELLRTVNLKTLAVTHYVKKCDTFARISRAEFYRRYDSADGFSCLATRSTKTHVRHYTTAIYEG